MIITTPEELRLYTPSHAVDHVETLTGILNSTEYEVLRPLLGQPLYDRLCEYYDQLRDGLTGDTIEAALGRQILNKPSGYMERLLFLAQPCIAFKTIESAIALQVLSINNAGINYTTAEDYQRADKEGINIARTENNQKHHAAVNRLLEELEHWYILAQQAASTSAASDEAPVSDDSSSELQEIAHLWRQSRYFYLAAQLLVPSAVVLEEYLPFYQNREKFIQLLPDLNFIQEELITDVIGEDFCALLTDLAARGTITDKQSAPLSRILRKLRKITALFLEGRTTILKIDKERKIHARDEAVRLLSDLRTYCVPRQETILKALDELHGLPATAAALLPEADRALLEEDLLQSLLEAEAPYTSSPYFVAPAAAVPAASPAGPSRPVCCCTTAAQSNGQGPLLVTPPLL